MILMHLSSKSEGTDKESVENDAKTVLHYRSQPFELRRMIVKRLHFCPLQPSMKIFFSRMRLW
jgi:hypothetical protein